MYTYTWYQWLSFFYIYSFFGWIFESAYVSVLKRRFVNRGFLRLPLLPLYGFGAVIILWVSLPFRGSLPLVFLSGAAAATALEYVTGYVMERLFRVKYWDYSNKRFQLDGYICLSSSVAWGFLTILLTEVIHQPVAGLVLRMDRLPLFLCLGIVSLLFAADAFESTREALALGRALESLAKLRAEIDDIEARLTALREEAAELRRELLQETEGRISDVMTGTRHRLSSFSETAGSRLTDEKKAAQDRLTAVREVTRTTLSGTREGLEARIAGIIENPPDGSLLSSSQRLIDELKERMNDALLRKSQLASAGRLRRFYRRGLLSGNPGATSRRFPDAFAELRRLIQSESRRTEDKKHSACLSDRKGSRERTDGKETQEN